MPRIETLAARAGSRPDPTSGALSVPLQLATTYEHTPDGQLPQGWLGFEGTHLAALPAAWYKPNLFWLGLPDLTVFSSSDYFPLLPWVFLYWVGYFFARWFRARCTAQPGLPPKALRPLCAVGSRTLLIYMLHQPVIYGALLGLRYLGFV